MSNYKLTLNLPSTKFPMRANLTKLEPKIITSWMKHDIYNVIRKKKKGKKLFYLHDGPPYANGDIHIGHATNKILKDIILKSKALEGFDICYVPGWDCHGLPIELKIEKKYGKPGKKISEKVFRDECRKYAQEQLEIQKKAFIRLGVFGDWKNSYSTMDFRTEANTIRTLGKIIDHGHLHQGRKPVNWCLDCQSALAEAEVEYYKYTSSAIYVSFLSTSQEEIKRKFGVTRSLTLPVSLLTWTTTPWTLPGNRAIAVAPNIEYVLVQIENQALIIAKRQVKKLISCIKAKTYQILGNKLKGRDLEFTYFNHPFLNFKVPVILGDHVTTEMGTGAVHTAGGHGLDDYNISLKYNLEIPQTVQINGMYLPGTHHLLDNINIFKGNNVIIDIVRLNGRLVYLEKIKHNYPHCWRHKSPTIFLATPQWFISMDHNSLRKKTLSVAKNIKWLSDWGEKCMQLMIKNRLDWCISRQRIWGVPIPIFINKNTLFLHPKTNEIIEKVAKRVENYGIQAWWDLKPEEILGKEEAYLYKKSSDTLDVWFDSGATYRTINTLHENTNYNCAQEAHLCLEGTDQYRGWFMSSLIISTAIENNRPYQKILTHGFVVDSQGKKMSKSIGNVIDPRTIIDTLGSDILRLWVSSTDYTSGELTISNKILKYTSETYRRIRNTVRFILANLNDFDMLEDEVTPKNMVLLDRWIIHCTENTQQNIINGYSAYKFSEVVRHIIYFCSTLMSSFYLDIIKDRQYTFKKNSLPRRSCQTALFHILEALVRWIAPILPYTAHEIWSYLPSKRSKYIFTNEWYQGLFRLSGKGITSPDFWQQLLKLRSEVNKNIEKARIEKKVGSSLETSVLLYVDSPLLEKLKKLEKELHFFLLTSEVKILYYADANKSAQPSSLLHNLKILVKKVNGTKCPRCWHYTKQENIAIKHQVFCDRCVINTIGIGEKRRFT